MNREEIKHVVSKSRRVAGKVPNPAMAAALCKSLGLVFETEKSHRKSFVHLKSHAQPVQVCEPIVDIGEFTMKD